MMHPEPAQSKTINAVSVSAPRFNGRMALFACLGGLLGAAAAAFLLGDTAAPGPLETGAALLLCTFFIWLGCFASELAKPRAIQKARRVLALLLLMAAMAAVSGAGALFEYLYGGTVTLSGNYIFMMDDSGSMSSTDPLQKRAGAFETLLQMLPDGSGAAAIRFASEVEDAMPITPLSASSRAQLMRVVSDLDQNGVTNMQEAFALAMDMVREGGEGRRTVIVLLSDGVPSDTPDIDQIIAFCKANNCKINAVYLSSGTVSASGGVALYDALTLGTGGEWRMAEAADQLSIAAASTLQRRVGLLSVAEGMPWLDMRAVYFAALGLLMGAGFYLACGRARGTGRQVLFSTLAGLGVHTLLTLGGTLGWPMLFTRLAALALLGGVFTAYTQEAVWLLSFSRVYAYDIQQKEWAQPGTVVQRIRLNGGGYTVAQEIVGDKAWREEPVKGKPASRSTPWAP